MPAKRKGPGGKRPGAGRPIKDASGKGRTVSVFLTPAEEEAYLQHGATVQDGIRNLVKPTVAILAFASAPSSRVK